MIFVTKNFISLYIVGYCSLMSSRLWFIVVLWVVKGAKYLLRIKAKRMLGFLLRRRFLCKPYCVGLHKKAPIRVQYFALPMQCSTAELHSKCCFLIEFCGEFKCLKVLFLLYQSCFFSELCLTSSWKSKYFSLNFCLSVL